MDWALHYNRLIERARSRDLSGYVERHHVVPKCLGGGEDRVRLTAREHIGKPKDAEHRASLSKAKLGKPFHWSPEHKIAHALAMKALGAAHRQKEAPNGCV
jgi:hypothetical protein